MTDIPTDPTRPETVLYFRRDERIESFGRRDLRTGRFTPYTPDDLRAWMARHSMGTAVPEGVRGYFASAQEMFVHGWLHYPFFTWAAYHALIAGELALRVRLSAVSPKFRRGTFASMLSHAHATGLLTPAAFRRVVESDVRARRAREEWKAMFPNSTYTEVTDINAYVTGMVRSWKALRNSHAHPHDHWYWMPANSVPAFEFVSDLANCLFPTKP